MLGGPSTDVAWAMLLVSRRRWGPEEWRGARAPMRTCTVGVGISLVAMRACTRFLLQHLHPRARQ
eukprot:5411763-Alexandrium_andersonii.AAC.1